MIPGTERDEVMSWKTSLWEVEKERTFGEGDYH